ncbi:MAG: NUDIX hydrolase [Actinobacteria bacterium]|nr:NUDIX hydrolase [Actinomycetota bacterium]
MIQAAGVVLVRQGDQPRVLVIRRDYRNDWSLPKGKLEPNEPAAIAAVRETLEETGYLVRLHLPLSPVSYQTKGETKTVHYWLATELAFDSSVVPNDEVSELRWVTLNEAKDLLTYPRDFATVSVAIGLSDNPTRTALILRHAISTKREDFDGQDDLLRPLTAAGFTQLETISALLSAYGVTSLLSSPALRCQQTLSHYAEQEDIDIVLNPLLLEENSNFTNSEWEGLLQHQGCIALCTHRPVIDELGNFEPEANHLLQDLPPAGLVVLTWNQLGELLSAERHEI